MIRRSVAGLLLGLAVLMGEARPAAAAAPAAPAPSLDELVARYRQYGLPLPPAGAPLVLLETGTRHPAGKPPEPVLHLGFLLAAPGPGSPGRVLVGTEEAPLEGTRWRRLGGPAEVAPDRLTAEWHGQPFGVNAGLATALQGHAVGLPAALCTTLLARSLRESAGHGFSVAFSPARADAPRALALMAHAHLLNTLGRPGTAAQRVELLRRMEQVLASVPGLVTPGRQSILEALRRSTVPSGAPAGSVAAELDALLDETRPVSAAGDELVPGPVYRRLVRRGFEIVPTLLAHLDDPRLTRWIEQGFNNFPPRPVRLGERVADLLQGLAGDELGRNWLRRQQGYLVDRAAALAWWQKAGREGEAAYAARAVVPADPKAQWPGAHLLELLSARHPDRLPEVYRRVLARRPALQSWTVARALARSSLPSEQKRRLFAEAVQQDVQEHRRAALRELKDLDAGGFSRELVKILDALPRTPAEPYWSCREAAFANLAMETAAPEVWQALLGAARRADVGLRMQLLEPMNYSYIGERQRQQRIAFLVNFLDDTTVRNAASDPRRYTGPYAAFTLPRIRVQDQATLKLAHLLQIAVRPEASWSRARWDALRRQVRAQLARVQ